MDRVCSHGHAYAIHIHALTYSILEVLPWSGYLKMQCAMPMQRTLGPRSPEARILACSENLKICAAASGSTRHCRQHARDRQRGNERRKGESGVTRHSGRGRAWGKRGQKPGSALQIHAQRHAPTLNSLPGREIATSKFMETHGVHEQVRGFMHKLKTCVWPSPRRVGKGRNLRCLITSGASLRVAPSAAPRPACEVQWRGGASPRQAASLANKCCTETRRGRGRRKGDGRLTYEVLLRSDHSL